MGRERCFYLLAGEEGGAAVAGELFVGAVVEEMGKGDAAGVAAGEAVVVSVEAAVVSALLPTASSFLPALEDFLSRKSVTYQPDPLS